MSLTKDSIIISGKSTCRNRCDCAVIRRERMEDLLSCWLFRGGCGHASVFIQRHVIEHATQLVCLMEIS